MAATVAVTSVGPPSMATAHSAEEEAAKKKNTDCVYFLASPLTCKKGDECEFRHNENARMNPRDCWYWLGGGCRNRDCPFRHPPLESRVAAQPPPPTTTHQKKPVPCFYFTQGYCAKGPKCQFMHDTATPNVYRLADKAAALAESSKAKVREEPLTDVPRDNTTPKKDNVYRLQDDPRKGKATPTKDDVHEADVRVRKSNKDVYTWKLSEQKQPTDSREEKKSEKQQTRTNNNQEARAEKRKAASRDKVSQASDGNGSEAVNEDFASPKSLAQIREEKRKAEDSGSPSPKRRRSEVGEEERGEMVRSRLCNGSDRKAEVAIKEIGNGGAEVGEEEEYEDDDFARKLRMFTS